MRVQLTGYSWSEHAHGTSTHIKKQDHYQCSQKLTFHSLPVITTKDSHSPDLWHHRLALPVFEICVNVVKTLCSFQSGLCAVFVCLSFTQHNTWKIHLSGCAPLRVIHFYRSTTFHWKNTLQPIYPFYRGQASGNFWIWGISDMHIWVHIFWWTYFGWIIYWYS